MKSLHEKHIEELLSGRASMTPREMAAANEILALRKRLKEMKEEKPVNKSKK